MRNPFINALPVYANALANQTGVQVVYGADKTCTTGDVVYITPANSDDPAQRAMTIGKTVHEIGHVKHSDFEILKAMSSAEKMFSNLLEDIFIEKRMIAEFPGTASDLATMVEVLVGEDFFSKPDAEATPSSAIQSYMLYALRSEVLHQIALDQYAQEAKLILASKIPAGAMIRLDALMFQVVDCENSHDVLDLTRAILKMIEDEAKKEEEKEQQQAAQDQNQQSQSGDDGDSDGQETKDDGQSDADAPSGADADGVQAGQESGSGQEGKEAGSAGLKAILGAGESDVMEDVGSYLSRKLDQNAASSTSTSTNVSVHKIVPLNADKKGIDLDAEQNRVNAASNAIKVRTQAMLQTQTMATRHSSMTGNRLAVSGLYRARLDGRVFQKVKEGIKIDTAIMMLVDISTSMNASDVQLACDAALATTLAFDRPGVKTAVAAFPYGAGQCAAVKSWDMRPAAAIPAYKHLKANGGTPMAEAMLLAGIELMKRSEKRKILFVNTDGDPNNADQARWVIDIARKGGIQVMGLGIDADAAAVFGKSNSRRISSIAELPSAMIGMLESAMS